MYGLIGKMIAITGERDALISILLEDIAEFATSITTVPVGAHGIRSVA